MTRDPPAGEPLAGDSPAPLNPLPARIGPYRVESFVHAGPSATVYRAFDETLARPVALKVLAAGRPPERLIAEARQTSPLHHPTIAGVYQAGVDPETGLAYIAFEWVDGRPLRALLRPGVPLPTREVCRIGWQIADAVAQAHARALVHGDLKADNVVLCPSGQVKLVDFGLSPIDVQIAEDELWGTPAYMAPELFRGAPRDERTDLFALGVLLHEMATGRLPFGGEDGEPEKVYQRLRQDVVPDPQAFAPDLPGELVRMIRGLVRQDPAERGPSAAEVARSLRGRSEPALKPRAARVWTLLFATVAVLGAVLFIERQRGRGGAEPVGIGDQTTPVTWLRVGAFVDPITGEETEVSRQGARFLAMFLHGDDPGSAVLGTQPGGHAGSGEGEAAVLTVSGTWGHSAQGSYRVRCEPGFGAPIELQDPDAARLAELLAERLTQPTTIRNRRASTLCTSESALAAFAEGVQRAADADFPGALELLREAQQQARYFPEATAWEAVIELLLGAHEPALARLHHVAKAPSRPARVLTSVLEVPVLDARARWGAEHPVATLLDLLLMAHDPLLGEDDWQQALRNHRGPVVEAVLAREVRGALLHGAAQRARDALLRYQTVGGSDWRSAVFERWLLVLEGKAEAGDTALNLFLLEQPLDAPSGVLRIPFLFVVGKNAAAQQHALHAAGGPQLAWADPELRRSVALILAIGGHIAEARSVALGLRVPFDPGASERVLAAIEALAGERDFAHQRLVQLGRNEGQRPQTRYLIQFTGSDAPWAAEPADASAEELPSGCSFERWRRPFQLLASAHAKRVAGDPAGARGLLSGIEWVGPDLAVLPWPELGFLAWIERITCLYHEGQGEAAAREFERFRQWWPASRAPGTRVARQADSLHILLEGDN